MSIEEQGFLSPDIAAYIAEHRAENQAWFGHAMDLNSIAQQLLLEFQVKDNHTLWDGLFFVRGLSSFQSAILLAERGMVQDARTIVRSCFETVFCLGALHRDAQGFMEKFEKHDVHGKRTFANALRAGELDPDAAEILSQFLDNLEPDEKAKRLNWEEVANSAGLDFDYNVYYRGISLDAAHPSPTALKRYYEVNGNNIEFRWGLAALDEKDIEETIIASCAACWRLVDLMAKCVEHPVNEKSSRYLEELKQLIDVARAKGDGPKSHDSPGS